MIFIFKLHSIHSYFLDVASQSLYDSSFKFLIQTTAENIVLEIAQNKISSILRLFYLHYNNIAITLIITSYRSFFFYRLGLLTGYVELNTAWV